MRKESTAYSMIHTVNFIHCYVMLWKMRGFLGFVGGKSSSTAVFCVNYKYTANYSKDWFLSCYYYHLSSAKSVAKKT